MRPRLTLLKPDLIQSSETPHISDSSLMLEATAIGSSYLSLLT